jgi:hypothetical protein
MPEIGDEQVRGHTRVETRFRSRARIRTYDVLAGCVREGQRATALSASTRWLLRTNRSHLGRGADVAARWQMQKSPARR